MRWRWSLTLCAVSSFVLAPGSGCSSAAKQAFYEFRGAQSKLYFNQPIEPGALRDFQSVRFDPATTELSDRLCPAGLLEHFDEFAAERAAALADVYPGGQPEVVVRSEILYFQDKGILSSAEMLTRVILSGPSSTLGDLIIKTESKAFRAGDEDALAKSAAAKLAEYLRRQKDSEPE